MTNVSSDFRPPPFFFRLCATFLRVTSLVFFLLVFREIRVFFSPFHPPPLQLARYFSFMVTDIVVNHISAVFGFRDRAGAGSRPRRAKLRPVSLLFSWRRAKCASRRVATRPNGRRDAPMLLHRETLTRAFGRWRAKRDSKVACETNISEGLRAEMELGSTPCRLIYIRIARGTTPDVLFP